MTSDFLQLSGRLVTPRGVMPGKIAFDSTIRSLEPSAGAGERFILPGFVDAHVHGGGGADTMDGADGVKSLAAFHARHGTTTILPTTVTAPWPDVMAALQGVARAMAGGGHAGERAIGSGAVGADVVGAHLEGPFVSPLRLGAQPPHDRDADPELVEEALATGVVRVVTMAPERPGALAAAARFAAAGARVSIGHSAASYEEVRAFAAVVREHGGSVGFTHLFNAMGGLQGRAPGVVGAAVADPDPWAELILDGHHVHGGSALAAWRACGGRLMLVSDAIRAAGTDVATSELGGRRVTIEGGAARTPEGALAGSLLTLDAALRRASSLGIPIESASHMLSGAPAAYLGLRDRGTLAAGRRADVVVLTPDLEVEAVYVGGRRVGEG